MPKIDSLQGSLDLLVLKILILPALILFTAALLASVPAAIGAVRIDPVEMLRAE